MQLNSFNLICLICFKIIEVVKLCMKNELQKSEEKKFQITKYPLYNIFLVSKIET